MKLKKLACLMAPLMLFGLVATGCKSVSVTSIQKTASYETEDTYTVTYSDGTSSTFTVKNGKNITADELYEKYKEVYGDDLSYDDFLKKYLVITDQSNYAVSEALRSSLSVSAIRNTSTQSGSAVFYAVNETTDTAYLVTNYHVAYMVTKTLMGASSGGIASSFACTPYGSTKSLACDYVGGAASADIAVLKTKLSELKALNSNIKPVTIGTGYTVGETVYAIGNAKGKGITATKGIVSVDSEEINLSVDGKTRQHRAMRIDAAIYHGNSGGGLFNVNGELIGITNGGDEDAQNINYAIPLTLATGMADNIIHYFESPDRKQFAYKLTLGLTVSTQNSKYVYDETLAKGHIEETIVVSSVSIYSTSSTIAYSMGIRKDDVITGLTIDGTYYSLLRSYDIHDYLLRAYSGSVMQISYKRKNAEYVSSPYTVKVSDVNQVD